MHFSSLGLYDSTCMSSLHLAACVQCDIKLCTHATSMSFFSDGQAILCWKLHCCCCKCISHLSAVSAPRTSARHWTIPLLATGAPTLKAVKQNAAGHRAPAKRKSGRPAKGGEKAKRRRMVGGILKHVGHAAPGQQCTQCGTQVRLLFASLHSLLSVTNTPLPLLCLFFGDECSLDC